MTSWRQLDVHYVTESWSPKVALHLMLSLPDVQPPRQATSVYHCHELKGTMAKPS